MQMPESAVRSGLVVEFEMEEGERGLKASSVRLPNDDLARPAVPGASVGSPVSDDDDSLCDVLTTDEFLRHVTELLLESAPSLTGEQLLQVRGALLRFGKKHGWTED